MYACMYVRVCTGVYALIKVEKLPSRLHLRLLGRFLQITIFSYFFALSSWHFSVSVLDDCFIDFRPQLGANMASEIVQTPWKINRWPDPTQMHFRIEFVVWSIWDRFWEPTSELRFFRITVNLNLAETNTSAVGKNRSAWPFGFLYIKGDIIRR